MIDHEKVLINVIRKQPLLSGAPTSARFSISTIFATLLHVFLPAGYPHSVSSDYIKLEASPDVLSSFSFESG